MSKETIIEQEIPIQKLRKSKAISLDSLSDSPFGKGGIPGGKGTSLTGEKPSKDSSRSIKTGVVTKKKKKPKVIETVCNSEGANLTLDQIATKTKDEEYIYRLSEWLLCNFSVKQIHEPQPVQEPGKPLKIVITAALEHNISIREKNGSKVESITVTVHRFDNSTESEEDHVQFFYDILPKLPSRTSKNYQDTSDRVQALALYIKILQEAEYEYRSRSNPAVRVEYGSKNAKKLFDNLAGMVGREVPATDYDAVAKFKLEPQPELSPDKQPDTAIADQPTRQRESKIMNKDDIKLLIKEAFIDKVYGKYPYSHQAGNKEEPKEDYMETWKKFCLGITQDKSKEQAITLAKILVKDLELFEDVLDLAGQNQSIGSEILKKMEKAEKDMV